MTQGSLGGKPFQDMTSDFYIGSPRKLMNNCNNCGSVHVSHVIFNVSEYSMNIYCDDITTLFLNGKPITNSKFGSWNQFPSVSLPVGGKVLVAVSCKNTAGGGGLAVQIDLADERRVLEHSVNDKL